MRFALSPERINYYAGDPPLIADGQVDLDVMFDLLETGSKIAQGQVDVEKEPSLSIVCDALSPVSDNIAFGASRRYKYYDVEELKAVAMQGTMLSLQGIDTDENERRQVVQYYKSKVGGRVLDYVRQQMPLTRGQAAVLKTHAAIEDFVRTSRSPQKAPVTYAEAAAVLGVEDPEECVKMAHLSSSIGINPQSQDEDGQEQSNVINFLRSKDDVESILFGDGVGVLAATKNVLDFFENNKSASRRDIEIFRRYTFNEERLASIGATYDVSEARISQIVTGLRGRVADAVRMYQ